MENFARAFVLTTVLACHLAAGSANAGPWLKDRGTGFAEFSLSIAGSDDYGASTYLEYGATANTTIGIDIGLFTNAGQEHNGYGTIFLRRALGATDGPHRLAYELGIGVARKDGIDRPTVKTGISWGRGIEWQGKSGWLTMDGAIIWDVSRDARVTKLDSTFGLNLSETMAAMLQVNFAHKDNEVRGKVEPSVVIRPRHDKFSFKVGAQAPLDDMSETAITLSLWHNF